SPSDRPAGSENCSSTRSNQRNTSSDIPRTPRPRLVEALPDSLLVRLLKQPLQGAGMQCQLQLRPADGSAPWLPFLCVKGSLQVRISGLDSRTEYIVRTRQDRLGFGERTQPQNSQVRLSLSSQPKEEIGARSKGRALSDNL
ncbi:hypothetical protein CYMTET_45609, partial [Cymbomonas tetramitiformis]